MSGSPAEEIRMLGRDDSDAILREVGMMVGEWGQIKYVKSQDAQAPETPRWQRMPAPKDGRSLLTFSQHIMDWIRARSCSC